MRRDSKNLQGLMILAFPDDSMSSTSFYTLECRDWKSILSSFFLSLPQLKYI